MLRVTEIVVINLASQNNLFAYKSIDSNGEDNLLHEMAEALLERRMQRNELCILRFETDYTIYYRYNMSDKYKEVIMEHIPDLDLSKTKPRV
jgi:hypothetical protein